MKQEPLAEPLACRAVAEPFACPCLPLCGGLLVRRYREPLPCVPARYENMCLGTPSSRPSLCREPFVPVQGCKICFQLNPRLRRT